MDFARSIFDRWLPLTMAIAAGILIAAGVMLLFADARRDHRRHEAQLQYEQQCLDKINHANVPASMLPTVIAYLDQHADGPCPVR